MAPNPIGSAGDSVVPLLMPELGNEIDEGTIVAWRVAEGNWINEGDVVCEIETDKAVVEYESPIAGRLARIVGGIGEAIPIRQPIALFAEEGVDLELLLNVDDAANEPPTTPNESRERTASAAAPVTEAGDRLHRPAAGSRSSRVRASPAARRIAAERGLDLTTLGAGSGPGGRIRTSDLEGIEALPTRPQRQPVSRMRQAIARRLQTSKQTVPHFYMRFTIDAGPITTFHDQQRETTGCSINDVIVLACGRTLDEFPAFRSRLEGEEFVTRPSADIGIAVGTDDGLVVPVICGVTRMSLTQLAAESLRVATRARDGRRENTGPGVFTVTNLGMFGIEEFAAIINPPESAILAIGAIREDVIVTDGVFRAGVVMTMTLSADHRVVDGLIAARFCARLRELLEDPSGLL